MDFTDFRPPSGEFPLRRNLSSIYASFCVCAFHPGNGYMQKCGGSCLGEEAWPFSPLSASDIRPFSYDMFCLVFYRQF